MVEGIQFPRYVELKYMQESLENIIFRIRGMWRYRWYAMAVIWLIILLGWVIISIIPIKYTVSAKVYVDTSTILHPIFKDLAIQQDTNSIVGLMARQIVSRPNLEQVANTIGLNQQARTSQEREMLLTRLEKEILVEGSHTSEGSRQRDFFTISYSNSSPAIAKNLVQELIDNFAQKTVAESLRDAEKAKQFLDQQIKEHRDNLNSIETRIREFKRQHADELPEQTNFFERLRAAQGAVNDVNLLITEAEFKRNDLQRQLAIMAAAADFTTADDSRIIELKKRLDELLIKYTDNHPYVIATKSAIADLEEQRKKNSPVTRGNPIIPNSASELIKVKLSEVKSEIAILQVRKEEYLHRVERLEKMKEVLTKIEAELQYLNQDYEVAKKHYDTLLGRRDSATMTGNIGQSGENLKFKIIDPPRLMDTWSTKARQLLILTSGVLGLGFAGGLGLAFFLSQIKPLIYGRRVLEELTGFPVYGSIPQIATSQMRLFERFDLIAFILAGVIILGTHGIAVLILLDNVNKVIIQELGVRG